MYYYYPNLIHIDPQPAQTSQDSTALIQSLQKEDLTFDIVDADFQRWRKNRD